MPVLRSGAGETGQAVTAVGDPPKPRIVAAARRRPVQRLRVTTTPGKLRLLLAGLVLVCLIWGTVAAWVVSQRASGASEVVSVSEPVSLDGAQIYRALSDADATAARAFLSGGLEPAAARRRYLDDIAVAASRLECLSMPARWRLRALTTGSACRWGPPTCGRPPA